MQRTFLPILIFLFLILPFTLLAQTATLAGSVKDANTGQGLSGATVFIIGTYKGAYTDEEGNFSIDGIKPGDYSIRFTYVGYAEKIYNGITLERGKTKKLDVDMVEVGATLRRGGDCGETRLD